MLLNGLLGLLSPVEFEDGGVLSHGFGDTDQGVHNKISACLSVCTIRFVRLNMLASVVRSTDLHPSQEFQRLNNW